MFSILIPVHCIHEYLSDSIRSCLNQDFDDFEVLVVVNGKKSQSVSSYIAKQFDSHRLRMYVLEDGDLTDALNYGLNVANYDWIVRHDSDDLSESDRLRYLKDAVSQSLDGDTVFFSNFYSIDGNSAKIGCSTIKPPYLFFKNRIPHPTVCFHRKSIISVGGYRDYRYAEDYDLWVRLQRRGFNFHCLEVPTVSYRTFSASGARKNVTAYRSMLKVQFESLRYDPSYFFPMVLTFLKILVVKAGFMLCF